jgi:hypothetical protein
LLQNRCTAAEMATVATPTPSPSPSSSSSAHPRQGEGLPTAELVSLRKGPDALLAALKGGKTLRVGMNMFGSDAGFFVYVTFVLNHLALLERLGVPNHCVHAHFGAKSLSKRDAFTTPNMYHDPSVGGNVWDYFFEPVSSVDIDDATGGGVGSSSRCPDPATAPAVQLDNDSLLMLHEVGLYTSCTSPMPFAHCSLTPCKRLVSTLLAPIKRKETGSKRNLCRYDEEERDSVFAYPHGVYAGERNASAADVAPWYRKNRMLAWRLMRERVRVKAKVRCLVDAWWAWEIVGSDGGGGGRGSDPKVLGVHLRGTDKRSSVGGRVVEPKEHFAYVDAFLATHGPTALVFVATDSEKFLEKMQKKYGARVRHYEVGLYK